MTGVERILDRALHFARGGQRNPFVALCQAAEVDPGDGKQDPMKALMALKDACGGSLVLWFQAGPRRTVTETVGLIEDALFTVQMGGP